jgi:hypothetical protein
MDSVRLWSVHLSRPGHYCLGGMPDSYRQMNSSQDCVLGIHFVSGTAYLGVVFAPRDLALNDQAPRVQPSKHLSVNESLKDFKDRIGEELRRLKPSAVGGVYPRMYKGWPLNDAFTRNEGALLDAFDQLLSSNPYLSGWQVWWLQQPLARTTGFAHGNGSTQRIEWAERAFAEVGFSPVLQAHASLTLARHGLIEANRVLELYDRTSPVVSPVVVLAMALLSPSAELKRAVTGDNRLHHWVFESASEFA